MQALANRIVIGDVNSPLFTFENEQVESVNEEVAVSIIGDELFIDQFLPIVQYTVFLKEIFKPTNYDGFKSSDGYILCGHYTEDLRELPYGTVVRYYLGSTLKGKFYIKSVERIGRTKYKLNGMSAIGLLDRQMHHGGIYTGQTFSTVLREIVGAEYTYTVDSDVAALKVYGWLPYSTRRRNLYQLIMAMGVNILRTSAGDMRFSFLNDTSVGTIPDSRIFLEGKVTYETPASKVEVTEHGYYYNRSIEEEVLFDNSTGDAVSGALITFDKPIYVDSIRVSEGSMNITTKGVNYCYATGVGIIVGVPYIHTTKIVSKTNESATSERVVSVEEATLVTVTNSENVLERLSQYYFNVRKFQNDINLANEECGKCYTLSNAYRESTKGFISKMSTRVTSLRRATCEIIEGYVPVGAGNTYTNRALLTAASGTWTVPSSVFAKDKPLIRVILIGKGNNGGNGENGESGYIADSESNKSGAGGAGGKGGDAGLGGKVFSQTIDCDGLTSFTYGRDASGNQYFRGGSYSLNSSNGLSNSNGWYDQMSGTTYALPGNPGIDGGAGGKGGNNRPHISSATPGVDGEAVVYRGTTYNGGAGGATSHLAGADGGISENLYVYGSGGGGGGAAAGAAGASGKNCNWSNNLPPGGGSSDTGDSGGKGANGAAGLAASSVYGCGGNGGNGGGGGGGGGLVTWYNEPYNTLIFVAGGTPGAGGTGGAGSAGTNGCIIIYY